MSMEEKLQLEHVVVQTAFEEEFADYMVNMPVEIAASKSRKEHKDSFGDEHFYRIRDKVLRQLEAEAPPPLQPSISPSRQAWSKAAPG